MLDMLPVQWSCSCDNIEIMKFGEIVIGTE